MPYDNIDLSPGINNLMLKFHVVYHTAQCHCAIVTHLPLDKSFADDIFKCIFMNEMIGIPIQISLKFGPKGPIDNNPTLVQVMAWC